MNTDRVFLGDIMYGYQIVEQNVVLIKYKNGYIGLNDVGKKKKSQIRSYTTEKNEKYYVKNLVPFYEKKKHKTLLKIRYDVLSDSRVTNVIKYFNK